MILLLTLTRAKELSTVQEKLDKATTEFSQLREESSAKISKLTTEIKTLKSHQRIAYYKIVRPDGTIEEKQLTETDIDESTQIVTQIQEEYKRKVDQIETKWETIHQERVTAIQKEFSLKEDTYQKEIASLKKEKITDINPKNFGLEVGFMSNLHYYAHATYDVWGPFFIGLHGTGGTDLKTLSNWQVGGGLGIRL